MDNYSDAHRLFLQIITAKRILAPSEVKSTYEKCCAKYNVEDTDLKEFVMAINQKIGPLGLTIRRYFQEDQLTDTQCFILVNTLNNEATRHASPFSPQEFSFLRKIIEHMVSSDEGIIDITEATNVAPHLEPRMKISDAEALIDRLIKNKWLLRYEDDQDEVKLSLSGLALAELETYFEDVYENEVTKCPLCKLITLKGYKCPSCNSRFHRSCAGKLWNQTKSSPFCPEKSCSAEWPHVKLNSPVKRRKV